MTMPIEKRVIGRRFFPLAVSWFGGGMLMVNIRWMPPCLRIRQPKSLNFSETASRVMSLRMRPWYFSAMNVSLF
jgi:hypothetical protein